MACGSTEDKKGNHLTLPTEKFDLTHWQINTPKDIDNDGIVDLITVKGLQTYQHPDYFYIDAENNLVFTAPNKAITSVNSTDARR